MFRYHRLKLKNSWEQNKTKQLKNITAIVAKQKNVERHMSRIPLPAKLTLFCCLSFFRAEFRIFIAHNNADTRDARDTKFCEMLVRGERNSKGTTSAG